jgi:hypothetical protein
LAEEAKKEEERRERLRERAELRARRRATVNPPRFAFPESPVGIKLSRGSNHLRLPNRADLGKYEIRNFPGKIRRVRIQPFWTGKSSARRFINDQPKRDILHFIRCAIKIQLPQKKDFVQDFIENPYFLRPLRTEKGRVSPVTASAWKAEDEIESSKGIGLWSSVAEGIARRHQKGKERRKELGRSPEPNAEISYLTVDCDFQEVPAGMPNRALRKIPEKGLQFMVLETREIIEGPKTLEETNEETRLEQLVADYMQFYKAIQVKAAPKEEITEEFIWKRWTPVQKKSTTNTLEEQYR